VSLRRADLAADPLRQFHLWHAEASASVADPAAVVLATAAADGAPSARMVLLKGADDDGFRFFTNADSRKGAELAANPRAAMLFHWPGRQVRIEGAVTPVPSEESDAYFASRAPESRLSAAASPQSRPVADRAALERAVSTLRAQNPQGVPRPPAWGGYRLRPAAYEFWQHGDDRLHDRFRYALTDGGAGWTIERLGP
jgi:pyridoxamine 5'-phosphate oxidase